MNEIREISALVRDLGFPVFLCVFLIVRLVPKVERIDRTVSAIAKKMLPLVLLLLSACVPAREFGAGFTREMESQIVEVVDDAFSKDRAARPAPIGGPDVTMWGSLGALAAYIVGSVGKAKIREQKKVA